MACVVLVRTMQKSIGSDRVIRERKYRIEWDSPNSPEFARQLYGSLNISSLSVTGKTRETIGSKEWTRINTKKSVPVYWEYRLLGPDEADMSDHFNHSHLSDSRTLPK